LNDYIKWRTRLNKRQSRLYCLRQNYEYRRYI